MIENIRLLQIMYIFYQVRLDNVYEIYERISELYLCKSTLLFIHDTRVTLEQM